MSLHKKPAVLLPILLLLSCGIPSYTVIDPPTVNDSDGSDYTLAFTPDSAAEHYILAYKLYWDNEVSLISTDRNIIKDIDEVGLGFDTLNKRGFIQMAVDTDPGDNYPYSSYDVTITATTKVTLTFDTNTGELSASGGDSRTLYRRVRKVDSDGILDDNDVKGKNFLSAEYDYQDKSSYKTGTTSVTIPNDSDGIDSDMAGLFLKSGRFSYAEPNYNAGTLEIAVAVYSRDVSPSNMEVIESYPVYLGSVKINSRYWDPNN